MFYICTIGQERVEGFGMKGSALPPAANSLGFAPNYPFRQPLKALAHIFKSFPVKHADGMKCILDN
jgi:hypothetical protein